MVSLGNVPRKGNEGMTKVYSSAKAAQNVTVNSLPVVLVIAAQYVNKKTGLNLDEESLNTLLIVGSTAFYWVKNWIKNRNKQ